MATFFGKATKILVGALSVIVQVANLFLGNIIVFEATEGVLFDWMSLLKSKLFWGVLIFNVIYYTLPFVLKQQNERIDEELEKAISEKSVELINFVAESVKQKDFESSNKTIKVLDKFQKRRRKW